MAGWGWGTYLSFQFRRDKSRSWQGGKAAGGRYGGRRGKLNVQSFSSKQEAGRERVNWKGPCRFSRPASSDLTSSKQGCTS